MHVKDKNSMIIQKISKRQTYIIICILACKEEFVQWSRKMTKEHQQKWRIVGFKGLWNECVYLPTSLLASLSLVSSKNLFLSNDDIQKIHAFSKENFLQSELPKKKLSRTKQCTSITLEKSSCLLLVRIFVGLILIGSVAERVKAPFLWQPSSKFSGKKLKKQPENSEMDNT